MDAGLVATGVAFTVFGWSLAGCDALQIVRCVRKGIGAVCGLIKRAGCVVATATGKGSAAQSVTLSDVSEMVDVVRLGLSAGLSFDAALGLYCEQRPGELAESMSRARLSWQLGLVTREEGLMSVAHALGIRQLETFAVAVSQAYALGAPLAETLARQGKEMRAAHRAEVERQIERAPVKMLIPTGTLILPALLLSIVGPLLAAGGMV